MTETKLAKNMTDEELRATLDALLAHFVLQASVNRIDEDGALISVTLG